MKNILNIKHSFAILVSLLMGLNLVSCADNNEDAPPVKVFVQGQIITISEAKAFYNEELAKTDYKTRKPFEIKDNVSIKGIITTDDNLNGNLYKEAYIQDDTGGLLMKLNTTGALNIGDSVIVNLKGLFLGDYGDFVQLGTTPYTDAKGNVRVNNIDVDDCMSRFKFMNPTIPIEVTLFELKSNLNKYLGCLVKIDGVQFAAKELGKTYGVPAKDGAEADYGNRDLEDCFKNKVVVRSSGYSSFAGKELPEGNGSIVGIVTKYTSTIQIIIRDINEVKLDSERCSGNVGGTPAGSGTKSDPYNIAWVMAGTPADTEVWIKGYIVGSAEGVSFDGGLKFDAPFVGAANIGLAATPDEKNPALIVPIQLVGGSAVRAALNLVDNAGNHKKEVYVKGKLQTYFSKNGIKSTTGYWWPDTNTGLDPDGGNSGPSAIFEETFQTGVGGFKTFSIKGSQTWNHDATNKYMKISGNQGGANHENEDWLVSPQINLSGVNNAKLTFDHTGKMFGAPFTDLTVWVSTNFDGNDVSTAAWTQVSIPTYMSGTDWTFVGSGELSLAGFNNQSNVFIAFKYTSADTLSGTWEVKNVKVSK